MEPADLRLVHEWLQRPHVRRWWKDRETYEEVVQHYLPSIDGTDPTDLYLALLDEQPISFIQTYLVSDYPDYAAPIGVGVGVAGLDLLIGDEALTGQGIGSEIIDRFVEEVVFGRAATKSCVADPDVRNVASIRAFEKAGFAVAKEFVDPEDGELHALVRRDRTYRSKPPQEAGSTSAIDSENVQR
jgi:RimJ/RimL family protein N-acetyltransferase